MHGEASFFTLRFCLRERMNERWQAAEEQNKQKMLGKQCKNRKEIQAGKRKQNKLHKQAHIHSHIWIHARTHIPTTVNKNKN